MIKDILKANENVKPNTDFLKELKIRLPEFFTIDKYDSSGNLVEEGTLNFEKLHNILLEKDINELRGGYQLNFIGKDYAKKLAGERPTTVVVPDTDHNNLPENVTSKNLFFTGDNLEVLKHFQNNYAGKIDIIYIDPPYNTGSDGFLYPDKFEYSDQMLKDMFGLSEKELERLKSIQGKASHSAWLTFIYPRLWLAKRLLKDTGVIFVSIDDNEQANLKLLMDEIFGESSFVEEYIWESTFRPDNSSPIVRRNAEFVLLYAKNRSFLKELIGSTTQSEGLPSLTKNSMNSTTLSFDANVVLTYLPNGDYKAGLKSSGYVLENDVTVFNGYISTPFKLTGKVIWGQEYLDQQLKDGTEIIIKSDGFVPYSKKKTTTSAPNKLIPNEIVLDVLAGRAEVSQLFDKLPVFAYPKPTSLLIYLIKMLGDKKDSIILDFFAGSATTADAILQINAKDNGNRQYIMVQIDEPTYETDMKGEKIALKSSEVAFNAGYLSIDEISRERIKRAINRLVEDNENLKHGNFDKGFKHYRVVSPVQPVIDDLVSFDIESGLFLKSNGQFSQLTESGFDDMITPFSSKGLNVAGNASGTETILTTWIITDGYKLDAKMEKINVIGYESYLIERSRLYLINLGWGAKQTMELLNQIGTNILSIQTIVIYGYSFDLESLRELELGLKQLNTKVNLVKRY